MIARKEKLRAALMKYGTGKLIELCVMLTLDNDQLKLQLVEQADTIEALKGQLKNKFQEKTI